MTMKTKTNQPKFGAYQAIMDHNYDPKRFLHHFTLAGISCAAFSLREECETHTALWDDPTIQARMRSKIDARPKPVFSAEKFMSEPFESGYWRNAFPDLCADEVFDQVLAEMSEADKSQLRVRIKNGDV
jgi:hypothetical protein